ncbi:glycoside hydrolase superfamily [Aspergillus californicus]
MPSSTNKISTLALLLSSATTCLCTPYNSLPTSNSSFNWTTTPPLLGTNLGGWLVQESTIDNTFWSTNSPSNLTTTVPDEWTLCALLGPTCPSVFEERYETFITESDIDDLAAAGVNLLRIPTTYAAWIELPGSKLYSGSQKVHLRRISEYAIQRYAMHIIIDVHSLPGGLNGLTIGEAVGHWGWFFNETAWDYSLDVIESVLDFIEGSSQSPGSFTLEPMNEPADRNMDLPEGLGMAVFGTPEALSDEGAGYVMSFWKAVVERVERRGLGGDVAVMVQSFKLPGYWGTGNFSAGANVVFDMHNYYFEGRETTSENLPGFMLSDAQAKSGDGAFPVFVGEWSVQAAFNNTLGLRERNLRYGLGVWEEYTQGSAYWTAKFEGNASVDGEGSQKDYWSLGRFIEEGYLS